MLSMSCVRICKVLSLFEICIAVEFDDNASRENIGASLGALHNPFISIGWQV